MHTASDFPEQILYDPRRIEKAAWWRRVKEIYANDPRAVFWPCKEEPRMIIICKDKADAEKVKADFHRGTRPTRHDIKAARSL